MNITIDVTADDIATGDIHSVTSCPIGLAMQRAIGHAEISVDRVWIIDKRTGNRSCVVRGQKSGNIIVSTPQEAVDFQTAMMAGQPVKPFSFAVSMEKP